MALDFLGTARDELFPGTPVVFFTDTPSTPRMPNSTGVVAEPTWLPRLRWQRRCSRPSNGSTWSPAPRTVTDSSSVEPARSCALRSRLAITYLSGLPTPELKRRLASLPANSIVYYLFVNRDGAGADFHPLEYLQDIAPIANAPIYSWVDSAMGHGIVGGSLKIQEKQTEAVAELALRVLGGESPDSMATTSTGSPRQPGRRTTAAPVAHQAEPGVPADTLDRGPEVDALGGRTEPTCFSPSRCVAAAGTADHRSSRVAENEAAACRGAGQ